MIQTQIDAIIKAGSRSEVVSGFFEAVGGLQTEVFLFMLAVWIYGVLFPKLGLIKRKGGLKGSRSVSEKDIDSKNGGWASNAPHFRPPPGLSSPNSKCRPSPSQMSPLAQEIENSIRDGKDATALAQELDSKLGKTTPTAAVEALADLLDSFSRTARTELALAVRQVLSQRKLKFDARLGELVLRSLFDLQLTEQFEQMFAEADAAGFASSPSIGLLGFKAALRASNLKLSMDRFQHIGYLWQDKTASAAPVSLVQHLTRLAVQQGAVSMLGSVAASADVLNVILHECFNALSHESSFSHDAAVLQPAVKLGEEAIKNGIADVVTFNTLIKIHLQSGSLYRARKTIEKMRESGFQPNVVTFNELLETTVKNSLQDARALVDEMKACGLLPNNVTCSILLKGIQPGAKAVDVERIMAIITALEDQMDEVLLSSVVDACIRVGRGDLLLPQLQKHRGTKRIQVRCAHTYGSIIRAYGYVQDIDGIWETWRDMKTTNILPTSITLGCMVEAMVTNGDVDGGYEFLKEVQKDSHCKTLVNAVMYCSLLKGFSHQKRFDQVWSVYQEMLGLHLEFSIVTFNTLVDACARSGEMSRISGLLEDMVKQGIEPNLITYSAILKGYCKENRIDKALELLDSMRQTTKYRPDEIMFNTLLDGCARVGLIDRGMQLLEEMQELGIKPTNFTLSVLVKLASRGRQLDRAFKLCEEISAKFRFKLNVHVYSNLVQACIKERDLPRALSVLEHMTQERVRPDQRTYALLIRAHAEAGKAVDVAGLLRAAVGLEDVHPKLAKCDASMLQPQGRLPEDLVTEAVEAVAASKEGMAVELLRSLKRKMPGLKIDTSLKLKMTTRACGVTPPWRQA